MHRRSPGLKDRSAVELRSQYRSSRRARTIDAAKLSADDFLAQLLDLNLHADAVQFFANWMKPREMAWWTCLCVWHAQGTTLSDDERSTLRLAAACVREPSAESAAAATKAAHAGGLELPAMAAAMTAALACKADDEAAEKAAANMGALAILRAANKTVLAKYIELGRRVADGRHRWDAVTAPEVDDKPQEFADWAEASVAEPTPATDVDDGFGKAVKFRLGGTKP